MVLNHETCNDFAKIVNIHGQGCNNPTGKGVEGFQVDFDVLAIKGEESKSFHIVFQTMERNDNLRAYNGIDMAPACYHHWDIDDGEYLIEFLDWKRRIFNEMTEIAEKQCKEWFEYKTPQMN